MSARADLTGQYASDGSERGEWAIVRKAPAQSRVPFWTVEHHAQDASTPCPEVDLPHVSLTKAIAGKGGLPRCVNCTPEGPRIDHGMHLACGSTHLLGTACPDGVQREPGPNTPPGVRVPATTQDFPAYPAIEVAGGPGSLVIVPAHSGRAGDSPWSLVELAEPEEFHPTYNPEPPCSASSTPTANGPSLSGSVSSATASKSAPAPVAARSTPAPADEPAAHLMDASTGALVVHGRVDRLDAPQPLLDVIRRGMEGRERNHQSQPGPSQIGGCERKLGYHLAFGEGNGARDDGAWRPEVGTAVHAWLDEMFAIEGRTAGRWIAGYKVTGPVAGTLDLYDAQDRRVIDFKVSGKTVSDKAAKGVIYEKYETQLDLYGLGMLADGYPVERVALLFLPPAGSLSDAVWYDRPFDITRALAGVAKRDRIAAMLTIAEVTGGGPETVLSLLSITEDFCGSCAAFGKFCEGGFAPTAPALTLVGAP